MQNFDVFDRDETKTVCNPIIKKVNNFWHLEEVDAQSESVPLTYLGRSSYRNFRVSHQNSTGNGSAIEFSTTNVSDDEYKRNYSVDQKIKEATIRHQMSYHQKQLELSHKQDISNNKRIGKYVYDKDKRLYHV